MKPPASVVAHAAGMRAASPPPDEDAQAVLEGLCRVLSSPNRNAGARLQALHHINTLSTHSDATRNSVTSHALVPLTTALVDSDVNVHCEAASAIGNLVHGSPARAAQLIEAGVVGPLMNLLRERHPTTLTRASLTLGALLRASVACRQQLEVYGRETLLPLMLSHNQQVCDGAEYAILGLYGGGDDPAQAMALRAQVAALRASKESWGMLQQPGIMQTSALPPAYATPTQLPRAYEYAVLSLGGSVEGEHVTASADGPPADVQVTAPNEYKTERKPVTAEEYASLVGGWMLASSPPIAAEALAEPPRETGARAGSPTGAV